MMHFCSFIYSAFWYVYACCNLGLGHRGKDVDHRNLISLTGSPADSSSNPNTSDSVWNVLIDQVKPHTKRNFNNSFFITNFALFYKINLKVQKILLFHCSITVTTL